MSSKHCLAVAVAAGVVVTFLVPVLALAQAGTQAGTQTGAQAGPMQGACMSDVKALCGSAQPGGGRIRDCMREHRAELSVACKLAIADRMLERGRGQGAGPQPTGARAIGTQPAGASAGIRPVPEN
jgi:hypothetical protein